MSLEDEETRGYLDEVRLLIIRFANLVEMHEALVVSSSHRSLPVPGGETVSDGELALVMFEISTSRRATAAAARALCMGPVRQLCFERRDWERLVSFACCPVLTTTSVPYMEMLGTPVLHGSLSGSADIATWDEDAWGGYEPDTDPAVPPFASEKSG